MAAILFAELLQHGQELVERILRFGGDSHDSAGEKIRHHGAVIRDEALHHRMDDGGNVLNKGFVGFCQRRGVAIDRAVFGPCVGVYFDKIADIVADDAQTVDGGAGTIRGAAHAIHDGHPVIVQDLGDKGVFGIEIAVHRADGNAADAGDIADGKLLVPVGDEDRPGLVTKWAFVRAAGRMLPSGRLR